MGLLNDTRLDALVGGTPPLVSGVRRGDTGRWNSRIQPASIDLSMGNIYIPGARGDSAGSEQNPIQQLLLEQGQTAVVETLESLHLPPDVAGIGFPPSSVSMKGLLMTNPGHVDPGFEGRMRFTVINIAKAAYDLKSGDLICTLLFFEMNQKPAVDYSKLDKTDRPPSSNLESGLLNVLSRDFMDIDRRAEEKSRKIVDEVDLKSRRMQIAIPIMTALITGVVTLGLAIFTPLQELKDRIVTLEQTVDSAEVEESLENLTDKVADLEKRLDLEATDQ